MQKRKATRKVIFKRAEAYVKEYKQRESEEIRLRRQAKSVGGFFAPAENKLAFVVRIRGYESLAIYMRDADDAFQYQRHQPQGPQDP